MRERSADNGGACLELNGRHKRKRGDARGDNDTTSSGSSGGGGGSGRRNQTARAAAAAGGFGLAPSGVGGQVAAEHLAAAVACQEEGVEEGELAEEFLMLPPHLRT